MMTNRNPNNWSVPPPTPARPRTTARRRAGEWNARARAEEARTLKGGGRGGPRVASRPGPERAQNLISTPPQSHTFARMLLTRRPPCCPVGSPLHSPVKRRHWGAAARPKALSRSGQAAAETVPSSLPNGGAFLALSTQSRVDKNCLPWAREYLNRELANLEVTGANGAVVKTVDVTNCEGDVDLNQRKGKVITLFDLKLTVNWTGSLGDVKAQGKIDIPEIAHDTEEDEYVVRATDSETGFWQRKSSCCFAASLLLATISANLLARLLTQPHLLLYSGLQFDISVESESRESAPIKETVRKELTALLRRKLTAFAPALIESHAKDIQYDQAAACRGSPTLPANQAAVQPTPTTAGVLPLNGGVIKNATAKNIVNTTTLTDTVELVAPAHEVYEVFLDPERVRAWTRAGVQISRDLGSAFSLFDGNVTGRILNLEYDKMVVQSWRLKSWPEGHYSTVTLTITQNSDSTTVHVKQEGIPVGELESVKQNWKQYYWNRIKATFGFGAVF
ncbi:MAG: activator of Hsp90 ATPase [Olpidium bornovanus]|uniref:Activator of Hsp90 ATPase n=1 Tax=Olpidium bornovanus TaxID=278681 RepID=A0A8H7ZSI8_9FUNG|nr:MAG: activator of Hsp90 ATPase [Olpidium bornovanus]